MTNDIDLIRNILLTAKQTLGFYADENNYVPQKNNNNVTNILLDGGHQATHTLESIDRVLKMVEQEECNYNPESFYHENQPSIDEIKKMLSEFKNFEDEVK